MNNRDFLRSRYRNHLRKSPNPLHKEYNPEFFEGNGFNESAWSDSDVDELLDALFGPLQDREYFEDTPEIVDFSISEDPANSNFNTHMILRFNTIPVDLDSAFNYAYSDHNGQYCVYLILDENEDEGTITVLMTLVAYY